MAVAATDSISTAVAHHDGIAVLAVGGVVDLATAPALEDAITEVVTENVTALVIDLSAVEFLASVGLRILVTTHEQVSKSAQFAVVASGPATSRPIQLTSLDETFSLYPTLAQAMDSMRAGKLQR